MKISTVLRILFCVGLFILPFVYWPWAEVTHEVPRVWFALYWIELLVLASIYTLLRRKTLQWGDNISLFCSVGFFIVACLASFLGVDRDKSFWGNYWRFDGLLVLLHCIGISLFLRLWWHSSWRYLTTIAITIGSLGVSTLALWSVFRVYILKDYKLNYWNNAFGSTFGQPNYLAGYLVISIPLLLYKTLQAYKKRTILPLSLWVISTVIVSAGLFFTRAWAAAPLLIIMGVIIWLLYKKSSWYYLVLTLVSIIICTGIFYYLYTTSPTVFVAESRERIIHKVLLGTWQRPLLGWGWSNVDYAFQAATWPYPVRFDVYLDKAHSTILEVVATTGIIGLSIYLGLILRIGYILYRKAIKASVWSWDWALFITFITIVLHSQTNVISIAEEVLFWIVVGIAGAENA